MLPNDTAALASANFNRASAGYTCDTLLAMLAGLSVEGFYTYPGNASHATVIGHRDNHCDYHAAAITAAAKRLRSYGLRLRVSRSGGRADFLTVYGPKSGGSAGRYSA